LYADPLGRPAQPVDQNIAAGGRSCNVRQVDRRRKKWVKYEPESRTRGSNFPHADPKPAHSTTSGKARWRFART